MPKCKPGFTRVCADIPTETHQRIQEYNKTAGRPIVLSKLINAALEAEISKAEREEKFVSKIN